ncbi:MAG: phosphate uptake regulator PhoU [Dysgonamonadaceae bacterium]|jgi:phosphate transport system protein|nr:phosphate uptake regulator PhoU [Dysgonamonadaceae bacterium]
MDTIKSKYLDRLLADFELLSEIILKELSIIRTLFEKGKDLALCEEIERSEKIIDSLDVKIRESVINAILLFNPKATDLRKIISYHDMTIYLERIGDLIMNISIFVKENEWESDLYTELKAILAKMLKHTEKMVSNAVYAFSCEDNSRAYLTIDTDDKVDNLLKDITLKLQQSFAGRVLTESELKILMSINTISHNIERIGDHATNLAESAIYLMEGKDIRHGNK